MLFVFFFILKIKKRFCATTFQHFAIVIYYICHLMDYLYSYWTDKYRYQIFYLMKILKYLLKVGV